MATPADVTHLIQIDLDAVEAWVEYLPGLSSAWETESPHSRATWEMEWRDVVDRAVALLEAYRAETMLPPQAARFRQLAGDLASIAPIARQLGLQPPPDSVLAEAA